MTTLDTLLGDLASERSGAPTAWYTPADRGGRDGASGVSDPDHVLRSPHPLHARAREALRAGGRGRDGIVLLLGRQEAPALRRPRLGLALMLLPMLTYLAVGLGLVLFVNRGFLLTEVLAFVLYCALMAALVIIERTEPPTTPM